MISLDPDAIADDSSGKYIFSSFRMTWPTFVILDSGSDYEKTRNEWNEHRERLKRRGKKTSDTEQEDEEEDIELARDVDPEPGLSPNPSQPAMTSQPKRKGKGKGKQVLKSGPISQQCIADAQELGQWTMDEAQRLADEYGTSRLNILILANLAFKEFRSANPYNQHKEWYAHHFPKREEGTCSAGLLRFTFCSWALSFK